CQRYCHAGATFSSQTGALEGVNTVEGYTEWMKGLFMPMPDASYEVRSFAVDEARQNVAAYGVFRGTHTSEGGPVPPTGKRVSPGRRLRLSLRPAHLRCLFFVLSSSRRSLRRDDRGALVGIVLAPAQEVPGEHGEVTGDGEGSDLTAAPGGGALGERRRRGSS